jgi:uncharacterized protein
VIRCPICRAALKVDESAVERGEKLPAFFPFCSDRCRLVDLGRWATGSYAIPGETVDLERQASEEDDG